MQVPKAQEAMAEEATLEEATGGSSKRGQSAPPPGREHKETLNRSAPPAEESKEWYPLAEPNLDHNYLFPETETEKCPIDKNNLKQRNEENDEYMKWILKLYPQLTVKDERIYCPYCDMKNHPKAYGST